MSPQACSQSYANMYFTAHVCRNGEEVAARSVDTPKMVSSCEVLANNLNSTNAVSVAQMLTFGSVSSAATLAVGGMTPPMLSFIISRHLIASPWTS